MVSKKDAPTVLFLHGALGTMNDLATLRELVEQKGFKTLAFNFSGHGEAAWPGEFRIDLFARDLDHYIKTHQLEDVAIFGYSMGGYVALYYMANFEDAPISSITTYGTKFNWTDAAVAKELPLLVPEHLSEKFPQLADTLVKKHGDRWKSLLRSTAHMMQNLQKLDGLNREDMHSVNIPVTLILGDQDRMVTQEETKTFASWLHHPHMKTLAHSKHELERSNLTELAILITEDLL